MGSHSSKAARGDVMAQDAAAAPAGSPSKSNGQENGHLKINGDLSPKADGEAAPLNGNGSAEPIKEEPQVEVGSGDAIEPAPVAEGGENKPEGAVTAAAPRETPKKKKRFSFKKSFKLSGISFRRAKKESGQASGAASPSEEQGEEEAAQGEGGAAVPPAEVASQAKEEAPPEAAAAPAEAAAQEVAAEREGASEEAAEQQPEEEKPRPPRETAQEDTQPEEASSKPAEADPSPAPTAPEQSE